MSQAGALVETKEPISTSSVVYVKVGAFGLMGSASVRYCAARGSKYRIGLYFPTPLIRPL
jgi:hypothetical protein